MRSKRSLIWLGVFLTVIITIVIIGNKPTAAQSEGADSSVSAKLDEILEGQKAISEKLDSIKEELRIVKIRITQQQ